MMMMMMMMMQRDEVFSRKSCNSNSHRNGHACPLVIYTCMKKTNAVALEFKENRCSLILRSLGLFRKRPYAGGQHGELLHQRRSRGWKIGVVAASQKARAPQAFIFPFFCDEDDDETIFSRLLATSRLTHAHCVNLIRGTPH